MPLLLNAALGKSTLYLFGTDYETRDDNCERDFIRVYDLAKAHVKSLIYAETGKGFSRFNIGADKSTSGKFIEIHYEHCDSQRHS
jgi:UDP-glucose 4-epimerase